MASRFGLKSLRRGAAPAFLFAGFLAGTHAWAQSDGPDAQVEASVLKALASAPALAEEAISTRTVDGMVTLSGSVRSEAARVQAENLAARTPGVKKVIDELTLTGQNASSTATLAPLGDTNSASGANLVLQSDGSYAPADGVPVDGAPTNSIPADGAGLTTQRGISTPNISASNAQRNDPDNDQALDQQIERQNQAQQNQTQPNQVQAGSQSYPPQGPAQPYPSPAPDAQLPQYSAGTMQPPYPSTQPPQGNDPYPNQYPNRYPYNQPPYSRRHLAPYPPYQPGNEAQNGYAQQPPPYGGQAGGQTVTVPIGALLRVRLNRTLSSNRSQPGDAFDGVVINDVVADGAVAIPRGAAVQGTVVESKASGTLKGRGELSVQLSSLSLGGKTFPLTSDLWAHHGGDKTIETIDKTAGFGAVGAGLGALAGGGVGAAVGGGVGAALGLGSSAASGRGQVFVPVEGVIVFHLAQPLALTTVSESEMQRLAYGAGPNQGEPRSFRGPSRVYVQPGYPYPYYPYGPGPYGYGYPR